VLVVAKHDRAHRALAAQWKLHSIEREYLAFVRGAPRENEGTVDAPIGRHPTDRKRLSTRARVSRSAVTHWRVEQRLNEATLLRVRLETGRTHQIRVHLAHVGYPIVGDPVYGGRRKLPAGATKALVQALENFQRQALHAARLTLTHPKSGKRVSFDAPLPADLTSLLDALARDAAEHDR
jgi:23S rRNA pseudouridine1911/1915/1917 synthase